MSFPSSPTNGQQTTVGGITYEYNTSENSWTRVAMTVSGSTGATGFTGATGAAGYSSSIFNYLAKTTITSGNPGDGYLIWDNSTQISASNIIVNHLTADNTDIDVFLATLVPTEQIVIQDRNDSGAYQIWDITANLTNTNANTANSYWTIPASLSSSGGTGTTNFTNNHEVFLALLKGPVGQQGATGATGLGGATGATGPSTAINATNDTSTTTLYPVMVAAAGSNQTPKVATSTLSFNAATSNLTIVGNIITSGNSTVQDSAGNSYIIGYRQVPQNSQSTNYTLVNSDESKHIYYTGSNANLTIPVDGSTTGGNFAVGSTITIINHGAANLTVTHAGSLYFAGNTTSASRIITTKGVAAVIKVAANIWYMSGGGVV